MEVASIKKKSSASKNVLSSSKDQIKSSRALSILWFAWSLQGVYFIKTYKFYHIFHATFTIIIANIIYGSGFVIELFFLENSKQLLSNLPMNISIVVCGIKLFILLRMRKRLVEVGELIDELDSRPFTPTQMSQLQDVVKICHRLAWITMISYHAVNAMPFISSVTSNQSRLIFEMWLPYDWKASNTVFWVTILVQFAIQTFLAMQNLANDISGPTYMSVINFHLRVIMNRIENLHYDKDKTGQETREEFLLCLKDHRIVMKIFDILQDTVSYIIFIQFAATVLVILTSASTYLFFPQDSSEALGLFVLILVVILQIFPCCYYSHKFMETTDQFVFSLYSSNWMDMSREMRQLIIIFMQMTQKSKVIIAGKQIPITLVTFVSVMKITYSLLTVVVNQV